MIFLEAFCNKITDYKISDSDLRTLRKPKSLPYVWGASFPVYGLRPSVIPMEIEGVTLVTGYHVDVTSLVWDATSAILWPLDYSLITWPICPSGV